MMSISILLVAYFWLFLSTILGAIAYAVVETSLTSRGQYKEFALVRDWLDALLRRGYARGYLRLGHEESGQFMQFCKYIRGKGDYGIQIESLGLNWPDTTLERAKATAEGVPFPHRIEPLRTSSGSCNGLIVDCGPDAAAAYSVGRLIWTRVFGLTPTTSYKVIKGRWSEVNELIDEPDHPPPLEDLPKDEQLGTLDARLRQAGEPTVAAMLFKMVLTVLVLVSGISLGIEMLVSRGHPPDWSAEIGTTMLQGSGWGLAYSSIFVLALIGIQVGRLNTRRQRRSVPGKLLFWMFRFVVWCLPVALFLTWSGY